MLLLLGPLVARGQSLPAEAEGDAGYALQPLNRQGKSAPVETGAPFFIEHFSPKDYRSHPQNWSITQDQRGLIYVANVNGILQYDGVRWRLIETKLNTLVRSLATDLDGTVYAGMLADFGYLAPDSTHTLQYVSLGDEVPPAARDFKDVWNTLATEEGVYFQTRQWLFRWDGAKIKTWAAKDRFHTSFVVRDQLYVRELGRGLLQMEGDSLRLAPAGERFANTAVFVMLPYPGDRILIGTREGFFLYDGQTLSPFSTQVDPFLAEYELYEGCLLPSGEFALSLTGGVFVIDERGRLVQVLHETVELPGGWVNDLYPDAQGGLWLAMNNEGVVRVDARSPLSVYDDQLGLQGVVRFIQRHEGTLYVATGAGLYALEQRPLSVRREQQRSAFVPVSGVPPAWDLLSTEHGLLAATDRGIYLVTDKEVQGVTKEKAFMLVESGYYDGRIYVGTKDGLAMLEREPSGWGLHSLEVVGDDEVRSIVEEPDGTLWLGTIQDQVVRVQTSDNANSPVRTKRFGEEYGLPDGKVAVVSIGGAPAFMSKEGIFRFRPGIGPASGSFYRDTSLSLDQDNDPLLSFTEDDAGNLWLVYQDRVDIARQQPDGTYARISPPVLRFSKGDVAKIFVEPDGVAWVSDNDELVRYNPRLEKAYDTEFPVFVRQIADAATGQVFYGGAPVEDAEEILAIPYAGNTLRIAYAAPTYNAIEETEYQYRLEGAGREAWSPWSRTADRVFAGLHEGTYRFEVRARNGQGIVASTASFAFRVLPPWYRTWWAYALYVLGFVVSAAMYRHYHRLVEENKRAKEQAEALRRERQANRRLKEANEALEKANRLKETFLSNTSHELRTPLTAILGFTAVLKEEVSEKHQEFLGIIEESGERLMDTLNALLDIAKIRAGIEEVPMKKVDLGARASTTVQLFTPLAERKGLTLELVQPRRPVCAVLNPGHFDRILQNLVSNAVKFTEEGRVTVEVERLGNEARLHVRDTGIGIDESFMPHLFDEFRQESAGATRSYEGSGLGLAIAARLVQAMNGTIEVKSSKSLGSVFTVTFPAYAGAEAEKEWQKAPA